MSNCSALSVDPSQGSPLEQLTCMMEQINVSAILPEVMLQENNQFCIALGALIVSALLVVSLGSRKVASEVVKGSSASLEVVKSGDAAAMPIMGSLVLFSLYVILQFVPRSYLNTLLSIYLSSIGIFSFSALLRKCVRANIFTGMLCIAVGVYFMYTGNWIVNNILAISIGIAALEVVHLHSFWTATILLIGLFFYDIFWVFGTDVMLTVATGIDGPIKIVFPQTIFGNHARKSLLGLGDMIIPGFFISQVRVFSQEKAKKGTFYYVVALVAYGLSLVNTMAVLVIFQHGQPALLFIVPWLLICVPFSALLRGDLKALLTYDAIDIIESHDSKSTKKQRPQPEPVEVEQDGESLSTFVVNAIKYLMGYDAESLMSAAAYGKDKKHNKQPKKSNGQQNQENNNNNNNNQKQNGKNNSGKAASGQPKKNSKK